jgi:hypothetical protein
LVGVTVVDGIVFFLPIVLSSLIIGAVFAPDWLRHVARFLDALAGTNKASPEEGQ